MPAARASAMRGIIQVASANRQPQMPKRRSSPLASATPATARPDGSNTLLVNWAWLASKKNQSGSFHTS